MDKGFETQKPGEKLPTGILASERTQLFDDFSSLDFGQKGNSSLGDLLPGLEIVDSNGSKTEAATPTPQTGLEPNTRTQPPEDPFNFDFGTISQPGILEI